MSYTYLPKLSDLFFPKVPAKLDLCIRKVVMVDIYVVRAMMAERKVGGGRGGR